MKAVVDIGPPHGHFLLQMLLPSVAGVIIAMLVTSLPAGMEGLL